MVNVGMICWDHDGIIYRDIDGYTLWWTYKKLLKMAIEIVDVPINSMVDLSIAKCDSSPEGMEFPLFFWLDPTIQPCPNQ